MSDYDNRIVAITIFANINNFSFERVFNSPSGFHHLCEREFNVSCFRVDLANGRHCVGKSFLELKKFLPYEWLISTESKEV